MSDTHDYSACWASCLGDCAEGMSREHFISECLFPNKNIMVQGFDWCKDQAKPLRIERLKKKILCRRHNRMLSDVDSAAKLSMQTMTDAFELFFTRNALRQRRWAIKYFDVDMLLLERWFVKTLINLNHLHGWQIGADSLHPQRPSRELVEVAFGLKKFSDAKGLYIPGKAGNSVTPQEGAIQFTAVTEGTRLVGGKFQLWGFPFLISIFPDPVRTNNGTDLFRHNVKYGFKAHDGKGREVISHFIRFKY
jgi:hypothetical protein